MFGISRSNLVGGMALVAALGVALGLTFAGDEPPEAADEQIDAQITVNTGTYTPQAVFEQYHLTEGLRQFFDELQGEAEVAHREGDQQKMMELEMRLQQRQQEVMQAFMEQMEKAIPEVASEADVHLIALEIQYTAPHVGEPTDLTEQLVAKLNAEAAPADAEE